MRVVQVIPDFTLGGIQKAGCVLANTLVSKGHEAAVVGKETGPRFEESPRQGLTHHVFEGLDDSAYAQRILELRPDVIHIHDGAYEEELVDALAAGGARIDAAPLLVSTPIFGRPPSRRATLRKTRTAVVGTYILYRLRNWLGMSNEQALRNGIAQTPVVSFQATDPPVSSLDPPEARAALRAEFGLPADAFVIGRIGRDHPWKWSPATAVLVDRFLERFEDGAWLSVGYPESRGTGELKERWGDRFVCLPQSADYTLLTKAYAAMDVQTFFSCAGECFAATLCEAAGVATPTIAGANPVRDNGQSEQIVDGVTGYLVATIEGCMEHLQRLHADRDELTALKESTRAYAFARWTPDEITEELLAYYQAWLSPNPLASDRLRRGAGEARAFDDHYVDRIVSLYRNAGDSAAWWKFKLAAVRNWRLFQVGVRLKRLVD